jgi:hypothetical protein
VANGEFGWAPSSGILPNMDSGNDDDVYRPCLNDIGLDVEEGSGDSEDATVGCGATGEFANINLNSS